MATNAQQIREYQRKIDSIVLDLPVFVSRLELVVPFDTVWRLLEDPPLGRLFAILNGNAEDVVTPPVTDDAVSAEALTEKMWEYRRLRSDVINYFERILTVIDYATLSNVCAGTILNLGNISLDIIDIYNQYVAAQPEEIDTGDELEDMESSSSSAEDN